VPSFQENGMLEDIASSRFGFWIVAAIMVVIDSCFLLEPGHFAYSISSSNTARLRISSAPFIVRNKELVSSLFSFPFQLFFVSTIHAPERTGEDTSIALARLKRISRRAEIFLLLSAIAAALLFAGPCLAVFVGIQASIVLLFPPLYLLAIATSLLLWQRRRKFGLSNVTVAKISAEIVLCPVLLVNISKRISLNKEAHLNAFTLTSLSNSPTLTAAAMRENISYHNGD
jgi:hypothetical protein